MSKNIKIELELPEFSKELSITVNLRKDGEVIKTSSFPTGVNTQITESPIWKQNPEMESVPEIVNTVPIPPTTSAPKSARARSGNMMDF